MKSNFVRWIGNRSQRTRLTQTERNRKIRQRSVLEQLEDRRLLAYTFTGGGTSVGTATSDGNADTLYIEPFAGLIYHSTDGIVFSPDWGGGLTIASSSANTINILQGNSANAHALNLGGTLGPESDLAAQINVNNGGPLDSLIVNDSTDTQSATGANAYTVTASTITGPPTMNVHLNGPALGLGIALWGGTAANQFNVTSTLSGEPVGLVGGASNDTFFISGNSGSVVVDGVGGVNTVTVGPGNTVANIHGAVNVVDTGGTTNLNISAFNDTAGTTATDKLNTSTGLAEIIGVTPAGSQVNYAPGAIQTLTVTNNGGAANLFTLDFSNGNVLPAAGPGASLNYNGGNSANPLLVHGELDLIGTLPTGAWGNETHTVTGASSGSIQLDNSLINYTGVPTHTINDVTPAVNYTFVDSSTPGIVDINTGPVFAGFQTLRIMSLDPVPAFVDTNIANKTNVTVNLPLNTGPDASFKLFVAYGSSTPVPGLSKLTVNQANDGDTTITATPPGVPVTVNQTNGEFTTEVTGTGLASGTTTTVNGSAGNGTMLTYDAGGVAAINTTNVNTFFFPGVSSTPMTVNTTLFGTSFGAGTLVYNNYKAVTVNNIAPGTQFIIPNALAAVRGTSLTNVDVATFISTAIGAKASDFQASINWGDGSPPYAATVVQDPVNPTHFEVIGSHTYSLTGTIAPNPTVSVTSTGSTGTLFVNGVPTTFNTNPSTLTSIANFFVTVADAGLAASANPLSAVEGTATPAGLILGTFLDTGGAQPTTNYTATINWGDGTGTQTLPPSAITQNGTSNTFSIAGPAHLYTEAGTHVFTLTISDSATPAQTVTVTGTASVADAALTPIASPPLTATEGASFTGQVASFSDANPTAPVSDFTATIFWGDGTSSLGVVSQPAGVGTPFVVAGTHTYPEDTTGHPAYAVQAVITDVDGSMTNTSLAPTAVTVNDAPLIASPGLTIGGVEGQPLVNVPVAVFTDTNPFGQVSDFTASINWGDGTVTTGVIQMIGGTSAGPLFEVLGSHVYTNTGPDTVTVTITDKGGAPPIVITSTVNVTQAPIAVTAFPVVGTEGNALTPSPTTNNPGGLVLVGSFTDYGGADPASSYTVVVNWGDGTTADNTLGLVKVVADGAGTYEVYAPAHVYQEEGNYSITLQVTDTDNSPITVNAVGIAVISDAALTPVQSPPIVATEGQPLSNVLVATFTDANPIADPADFTALIYWGDGAVSTGVVTETGGPGTPYVVHGSHTYLEQTAPGTPIPIGVVITDKGGASTNTTSVPTLVTVQDAALTSTGVPVAATEGTALSNVPVATFTDANPGGTISDFTATITWGDGAISSGVIVPVSGSGPGAAFQVLGSHTYAEQGSYPIGVVINDIGGSTTSTGSTATVADAALASAGAVITGVEGNSTGSVLVATFTDSNPLATAGDPSDFSAIVNWGDGSSSSGANVTITGIGTPNGVTYQVFATHTYAHDGSYQVTTTINDNGGAATIAHGQATIADATIVVSGVAPTTATEGLPFTGAVATIADSNPLATSSDFTATIYWSDGTSTLGSISGTGPFLVTGTHTFAEEHPTALPVSVFVTDVGGSQANSASTPTLVAVNDAPLVQPAGIPVNATEGQPLLNVPVAQFTDANPGATVSDFSATINWGDGTPNSNGIITMVGGTSAGVVFQVLGSHTYTGVGVFPITVNITDVGGSTAVVNVATGNSASATVVDATLTPTSAGAFVQGTEGLGLSQTGGTTFGPVVIGSFTDANPGATIADFTTAPGSVVVNWGDGTAPQTLPASDLTAIGSPSGVVFTITAGHVYKEEGTYQILTTVTDSDGSVSLLHGQAAIADAALAQAPIQPAVNVNENTTFTLPVASFLDANPTAPVSDFKATIDWGDGTPNSIGTISQPGGVGTPFVVTGTHSYLDSLVDVPQIGHFPITVHVTDAGGSIVTLTNTANVSDPPDFLTGYLNPSSATGILPAANVTKINQPNFLGTTAPFDHVNLFAVPHNGGPVIWLGETEAASNGAWSLTSVLPMPDGVYTVAATLKDQFGYVEGIQGPNPGMPLIITQNLTVDTTGPKVTNVFFDRLHGQIDVTYTDNLSGLVDSTLVDAANYSFSKVHIAKQKGGLYLFNSAMIAPGGNSTTETVVLTLGKGYAIRGGYYNFVIHSASSILPSGVQDVAGNALDGEFYGFFPSGNNVPGGDFVARLDAKHNVIFPPGTEVGHSTPNVPPGTLPGSVYIPTQVPGKTGKTLAWGHPSKTTHKLAITPAAKPTAHDVALAQVAVPKAKKKG